MLDLKHPSSKPNNSLEERDSGVVSDEQVKQLEQKVKLFQKYQRVRDCVELRVFGEK